MKKYSLFLFAVMIFHSGYSQEMLGIANSNYAGVSGMHLNPSSIVDSRLKFDINLISFGISFDNDYLYIPKEELSAFGFRDIADDISDKKYVEIENTNSKNLTLAAAFRGPSVAFRVKDNYFAVLTTIRSGHSISDLHYSIAKFGFEDEHLHYKPLQDIPFSTGPFSTGEMMWGELGISYGREILSQEKNYLKGAVTIKRLYGYASSYMMTDNIDYLVHEDTVLSVLVFEDTKVNYGHSFNEDVDGTPYNELINGHGWGFDIGFTYEYRPDYQKSTYDMDGKTLSNPEINKYKLRIGASMLDIGSIKFDSPNSKAFSLNAANANWFGWDSVQFQNTVDFDTTISNIFYGSPYASQVASSYSMALPTAFSMQADYNILKNIYINSTWVQAMKHSGPGVTQASMISLTPRIEKTWWEVSVPLSYYQYNVFRVGLSARFASLIIGSDKFGSILGLSDLGGMDFYMALKFSIAGSRIADRDEDGVSDKRDVCPDVKGLLAFNGCPDSDADGIEDSKDDCPLDKGLAQFRGCPDRDGDGIEDKKDSCPDIAGLVEFYGCPDTDADQIIDSLDECPTVAGLIQFNGCPDTDGDSIPDKNDDCPFVKGPVSNKGCPVVEKVPEKIEPVIVMLTEEEKEIIKKVFSNLEFETGKSVIRSSSFASLDELSELLKKKTSYKLKVDGHTDNVGGKTSNQKLSENRANAVKKYLAGKGIAETRITAAGYGLTRPIAPNTSPEGRQKNRRVEFTIVE